MVITLERYLHDYKRPDIFIDLIRESYIQDFGDLWGIFAHPSNARKRGIGKSVLAIKLLLFTYADWNIAKHYIFYSPEEFIRVFEKLVDEKRRIPMAVWDDAGAWLFRARFKNRFVIAVIEHLEVIRTHIANMFFTATTVGKLAKGIRESLNWVTLISIDKIVNNIKYSKATLYEAHEDYEWMFNRRRMPEPLATHYYRVMLPDEIYKEYKEMRDRYVILGLRKLRKELRELADKALEELADELSEIASKSEGVELDDIDDIDDLKREWGYG